MAEEKATLLLVEPRVTPCDLNPLTIVGAFKSIKTQLSPGSVFVPHHPRIVFNRII